jgi:hypothetical protein
MEDKLYILWTSGDPITADKMVLMYALNSKLQGWWKEVTVVIWGASAKLVAEKETIQQKVLDLLDAGVKVEACKACADQIDVTTKLERIGVDVKYWGTDLTNILKKSGNLITI